MVQIYKQIFLWVTQKSLLINVRNWEVKRERCWLVGHALSQPYSTENIMITLDVESITSIQESQLSADHIGSIG